MRLLTDSKTNAKLMQFTSEIYSLIEQQMTHDAMPNGDLQGCIEAIILKAIYYGKTIE